jgi:DNA-binding IclR family transcriptional regulator
MSNTTGLHHKGTHQVIVIVAALAGVDGSISARDLAQRLDLHRNTVQACLLELADAEWALASEEGGSTRWRLGPGLNTLALRRLERQVAAIRQARATLGGELAGAPEVRALLGLGAQCL